MPSINRPGSPASTDMTALEGLRDKFRQNNMEYLRVDNQGERTITNGFRSRWNVYWKGRAGEVKQENTATVKSLLAKIKSLGGDDLSDTFMNSLEGKVRGHINKGKYIAGWRAAKLVQDAIIHLSCKKIMREANVNILNRLANRPKTVLTNFSNKAVAKLGREYFNNYDVQKNMEKELKALVAAHDPNDTEFPSEKLEKLATKVVLKQFIKAEVARAVGKAMTACSLDTRETMDFKAHLTAIAEDYEQRVNAGEEEFDAEVFTDAMNEFVKEEYENQLDKCMADVMDIREGAGSTIEFTVGEAREKYYITLDHDTKTRLASEAVADLRALYSPSRNPLKPLPSHHVDIKREVEEWCEKAVDKIDPKCEYARRLNVAATLEDIDHGEGWDRSDCVTEAVYEAMYDFDNKHLESLRNLLPRMEPLVKNLVALAREEVRLTPELSEKMAGDFVTTAKALAGAFPGKAPDAAKTALFRIAWNATCENQSLGKESWENLLFRFPGIQKVFEIAGNQELSGSEESVLDMFKALAVTQWQNKGKRLRL